MAVSGKSEGCYGGRKARVMFGIVCSLVLNAGWGEPGWANDLVVTEGTLLWHSPSFSAVSTDGERNLPGARTRLESVPRIGDLAYDRYFESHGSPPPLDFLKPLEAAPAALAYIDQGSVVFPKTGARVTLSRVPLPPGSSPASPYLLSTPRKDWVLVIHPYYLVQGKETHHVVEVYSAEGVRRGSFDSLPTHVSASNPQLLVSPDRLGCCDSLRWSIRFYDLRRLSVSEYGCPESRCGDALFTRIGNGGPFLIVQETVETVRDAGSVTETSVHIVDDAGALIASGKLIFAIRDSPERPQSPGLECALPTAISAQSPYAVRYLLSVDPVRGGEGWMFRFDDERGTSAWKLASVWSAPSPSVVFAPRNGEVAR